VAARADAIGRPTRQTAYPTTTAMLKSSTNQIRLRLFETAGRGSSAGGVFTLESAAPVMRNHL
jgi:hypothetical protein